MNWCNSLLNFFMMILIYTNSNLNHITSRLMKKQAIGGL